MNQSIAVLPSDVSFSSAGDATRFLKLPHPRTGAPSLFLPANKSTTDGANVQILLEVQAVNATGDKQRSWFVGDDKVIGDGKMLLLTPFDPVFLLVKILLVVGQVQRQDSNTRVSLPYEDIFESASNLLRFPSSASTSGTNAPETPRTRSRRIKAEDDAQMRGDNQAEEEGAAALLAEDMRRFGELQVTKKTMDMICQIQHITSDLSTYRLDDDLLEAILRAKVQKLATKEAFEASPSLSRILAKEGITESDGDSAELHAEARQKAALDLLAGYLPKEMSEKLKCSYSFPKLEAYLGGFSTGSNLSTPSLSAASSSASLSSTSLLFPEAVSTFGMPKRRSADEVAEAEKKKKNKKTTESLGVRQLKKVSTKGMSPLTSFFGKKTPTPSPNEEIPPAVTN